MPSGPSGCAGAWGYRTDGDAGLMHVGARYYDAQVGRFITRETPLLEHLYLYCEYDAVAVVDPSGNNGISDWLRRQWKSAKETLRTWFDWGGSDLIGAWGNGAGGVIAKPIEGISAFFTIREEERVIHQVLKPRFRYQDSWSGMGPDELAQYFPGRYR
jgi:RHS repeat-associated protein